METCQFLKKKKKTLFDENLLVVSKICVFRKAAVETLLSLPAPDLTSHFRNLLCGWHHPLALSVIVSAGAHVATKTWTSHKWLQRWLGGKTRKWTSLRLSRRHRGQGIAADRENLEAAQDLALGQKITFQQRIDIEGTIIAAREWFRSEYVYVIEPRWLSNKNTPHFSDVFSNWKPFLTLYNYTLRDYLRSKTTSCFLCKFHVSLFMFRNL